ncbi:MAG: hypothetical protein ACRC2V_24015 [Xenococcaceae cyanobacterium]
MISTQTKPQSSSAGNLPIKNSPSGNMLLEPIHRAWETIHCQTTELCQNVSNPKTGKIYREALWQTWKILQQFFNLLLLLFLAVAAVFVGIWLIAYQSGYRLWEWLDEGQPTPSIILLKISDILLFPFRKAAVWLDKSLKDIFGLDLHLTEYIANKTPDSNKDSAKS